MRTNKLESWMLFQHTAQDQSIESDGGVEHKAETGRALVALGRLESGWIGRMQKKRDAALLGFSK
jgi:hypothetical protein